MAKKYENDFKVMLVELIKSGRTSTELSSEYNVDPGTIRRWRRKYESNSGDFSKKRELTKEEEELNLLRKELRGVTLERDILKKAVGIFSRSGR